MTDLLQACAVVALLAIWALSLWSTRSGAQSSADAHHLRRGMRR